MTKRLSPYQLTLYEELDVKLVTRVKQLLDFMDETKYIYIDNIVKSLHQENDIYQKIRRAVQHHSSINVIVLGHENDVNATLKDLQGRQKSHNDVLAYVRLYMDDDIKNSVWMKCDFPCPVVFDFCSAKATQRPPLISMVINMAFNEEFCLKVNAHLENYTSHLQTIINICGDQDKIRTFVENAFDECITEFKVKSIARREQLVEDCRKTPYYVYNAFSVKGHELYLIRVILETIGMNVKDCIATKIWEDIKMQLNICTINEMEFDVLSLPGSDDLFAVTAVLSVVDAVWDYVVPIVSVVARLFMPQDINSEKWRNKIASLAQKSLHHHKMDIVRKLSIHCIERCTNLAHALEPELQNTEQYFLPAKQCNVGGKPGGKLTAVSYGTDELGEKVIGLRAENFDHIYLTSEKGINVDTMTIKESTREMQLVDSYIDCNLEENDRIEFGLRRKLNSIIRNHMPKLVQKHSNLITISTSPVISRRSGIKKQTCIVIYCSCKGLIPFGESKFPRKLENMPVDVREGYVYLGSARKFQDPLRLGCSIGTSGESVAGSVGVFVEERQQQYQYGFLTCGHVLLPGQELTDPHIREKIRKSMVPVDVVQPSYLDDQRNITCGRLIDAKSGHVQYKGIDTGVDYAYVRMTERIPQIVLTFPSVEWEHTEASMLDGYTEYTEMGPPILDLNADDTEHCVYKFGRTSGFTKGVLNYDEAGVRLQAFSASLGMGPNYEMRNLYHVESFRRMFFEPGDSGASVYIRTQRTKARVIGLAVGGLCNGRECFVTPIGAVLDSVEPRVEIRCFPDIFNAPANSVNDSQG